jgi:hypothetical protein
VASTTEDPEVQKSCQLNDVILIGAFGTGNIEVCG